MLKHHHEYCKKYGYKVEHFILQRTKDYNPAGRNQTEEVARQFDSEIQELLDNKGIKYHVIAGNPVQKILELLK